MPTCPGNGVAHKGLCSASTGIVNSSNLFCYFLAFVSRIFPFFLIFLHFSVLPCSSELKVRGGPSVVARATPVLKKVGRSEKALTVWSSRLAVLTLWLRPLWEANDPLTGVGWASENTDVYITIHHGSKSAVVNQGWCLVCFLQHTYTATPAISG